VRPKAVRVDASRLEVLAATDAPDVACLRIWQNGGVHTIGYYEPDDPDAAMSGYVTLTNCTHTELENLVEAINMYLEELECEVR